MLRLVVPLYEGRGGEEGKTQSKGWAAKTSQQSGKQLCSWAARRRLKQ